jgi:hypothetical protein
MPVAANEQDFADRRCREEANGAQWRDASHGRGRIIDSVPDASPDNPRHVLFRYNGGLVYRRRSEFDVGDRLVRFSTEKDRYGRRRTPEEHLNSPWWMNDARFLDLWKRARSAEVGLIEMARRQLAIPEDWSACDVLVVATPRVMLAAYSGPGRTAVAEDDRRIIATEAPGLWIDQLYVPGLGRKPWLAQPPANIAPDWLRFDRMRPTHEVDRGYSL